MTTSAVSLDFDGFGYLVSIKGQALAAFATVQEALDAKYDIENGVLCPADQKVPPAMRLAREKYRRQLEASR